MSARILTAIAAIATVAAGGSAEATPSPPSRTPAAATAAAVRIVFPGGRVAASAAVRGDASGSSRSSAGFAYPGDGSVIVTGRVAAGAAAGGSAPAAASSSATAVSISIFDGEITADAAIARATAVAAPARPGGGFAGTGVVDLQALGRPHAFGRAELGGWGYLTIASHAVRRSAPAGGARSYDGVSVALEVHLTAAHGGLPAGSEIEVGYAEARLATPAPLVTVPGPQPGDEPALLPPPSGPLVGVPQSVEPPLAAGPYDFPVYGSSSFSDRYGDATGPDAAWQHGVDLLGQLGQPVLAVANGTVYSVGWNRAGGNHLRLRDRQGNEFVYAHLSAFSTPVADGAHVRAGQVIGYMGDTGESDGLPTHLHFEVHPVSMLFLGPGGAVDPVAYFPGWHRVANLAFPAGPGWAPKVPGTLAAPEPGAELLGSTDISSADGLDPDSLRAVLRPGRSGGRGGSG